MRSAQLAVRLAALPVAVFSAVLCWLWLQSTVLAGGTPPQAAGGPPSGTAGIKTFYASPLGGYTCVGGQWKFYISGLPGAAPSSIFVKFGNGVEETVALSGFADATAYYTTANPTALETVVNSVEAGIEASWNGSFGILQGPCEDVNGVISEDIPVVPAASLYPVLGLGAASAAWLWRRRTVHSS